MAINTKLKWIAAAVEAAFLIMFILLAVAVGVKNKTIRQTKATIKAQSETIDSLKAKCDQLWGMDCITINTVCNITQKGLVNTTASTQISKTVAEYTRGELIMALDSVSRMETIKPTNQ